MKVKLIFFFFLAVIVNAQNRSLHEEQNNFYKSQIQKIKTVQEEPGLKKNSSALKLNKKVFGYLPYWVYSSGAHQNIRYDLLSHLALFSFEADAAGNLKNPYGWPWNTVINSCKNANVKMIATITNFTPEDIHSLLADNPKRNNLFVNISSRLTSYGLDGVNIDFENVKDEDKTAAFGNFMGLLSTYLKSINKEYEMSAAMPVVNFGNWNFSGIAQNCDYLFVMCYDFYGSWSSTSGPSSPFEGTYFSVSKSFNYDYYSIVSTSPEKLILGVPYYGNYWKTKTGDPYSLVDTSFTKTERVKSVYYKDIVAAYDQKERMWDGFSSTPWLRWQDNISWNQIWYDNDSSLAIKYNLAIEKRIGGVGIWALGYDDGRAELWNLIERKFTGNVGIDDYASVPAEFILHQNYPNPFNPTTLINYRIKSAAYVALKIFDLLGREVTTLVNEFKSPGTYNVQFTTKDLQLTGGVYFYTLKAGSFSQTKKMVLQK